MTEINDAFDAITLAINHLAKKGIVVFSLEIISAFRDQLVWKITIDSIKFTGYIIIKRRTGEIIRELAI